MPLTSDEPLSANDDLIARIEEETIGLQVVLVVQWHFPVSKVKVEYMLSGQRNHSILEEFVLKALQLKQSKPMTAASIADLLGLDILFINSCVSDLNGRGILDSKALPEIVLNKLGRQHCEKGTLPDAMETREIEFYFNRVLGVAYANIVKNATDGTFEHYQEMEELTSDKKHKVNKSMVITIAKERGIVMDFPAIGKNLSKLVSGKTIGKDQTLMSEIWIHDLMEGKTFCRVWDYAKQCYQRELSELIELNRLGTIPDGINTLPSEAVSEDIISIIRKARSEVSSGTKDSSNHPFQILRGAEINSVIIEAFRQTEKQLIIFLPWIPSSVVDAKMINIFRTLAARNVQILIGFRIAGDVKSETKPMEDRLAKELLSVRNKMGMPMICFVQLANKREKEIVVDNAIHMAGSFNWLPFCGEPCPRGELIYYINDREVVEKQRTYWEGVFELAIRTLLESTEDSVEFLACMNFLFSRIPFDETKVFIDSMMGRAIKSNNLKNINNIAAFCINSLLKIPEPEKVVRAFLNSTQYKSNLFSILSCMKYNQENEYKSVIILFGKEIDVQFGKKMNDIKEEDAKGITVI